MIQQPRHLWLQHPAYFCAFGFGSGLAPKAPGTFGSLAALVVYALALQHLSLFWYLSILFLALVIGPWFCQKTSDAMGVHDHGSIVWDEFVGLWITLLWAPPGWLWMLLGFVFFRVFDVWKPFPIGWLDRHIHGGWGIMIDDIVAGFYGLMLLQACHYIHFAGFFE